ncbi:MAG: MotA/TolQ/ExbB proton channel family protein [Bacteriovoracaceae bacterium]
MIEQFGQTIAEYVVGGGVFTYCVVIIFFTGVAITIERFKKLSFNYGVDGASFMNELQRYILSNDIAGAIRVCSGSNALLPKVLKNGLKRAGGSDEDIQGALDATALEVIPKVEKYMNRLPILANVSTLCGLLGTIQGLTHTFGALALADPEQKAKILSAGLAESMHTTFLGILTAIIILLMHAFLTGKSEKIISEIDEYSVKMLDMLRIRKNNKNGAAE